ncbi:D-alanine--D-alanine ligase [Evansella cellulosilytica]|uniref:D-alanine--D-alanine ligase n=1 Tax=Evansella cellulosilytica (strain ATCC 21833 / DSM 2522 / FERM P-1141 / JCM 9156 / N-4) TaxID=649639 RepID=E6TWB7_EVAC2|nr:D-alanine--D-alanine ligase [Evansella cellulosilytica]ADU31073.1 D-alanine/D-alanine ligase [Evansella cellulosilytica DSM 2522]
MVRYYEERFDEKKVGIIFGGKSSEHQISLQSAKSIIEAIDKNKYELVLIGIDKNGKWYLLDPNNYLRNMDNPKLIEMIPSDQRVNIVLGEHDCFFTTPDGRSLGNIDVIFPILHGSYGEDGSIQGLLRLMGKPFIGPSVLGSAVSMDKEVSKKLLSEAGLFIGKYFAYTKDRKGNIDYEKVKENLGTPVFVKPANQGSSVGISKVYEKKKFYMAVDEAFRYDNKIVIEEEIKGREIECAVLGNEDPIASLPGEVLFTDSFYSYDAKYINSGGVQLKVPAELDGDDVEKVKKEAIKAFKALQCNGVARVDFFLTKEGNLFVNEINTLPGFTKLSMYPKLWEVSGLPYKDLVNKMIALAIESHKQEQRLKKNL